MSTKLNYSGFGPCEGIFGCCHSQTFKGTTAPVGSFKSFNDFPGYLPLADVVACSSSFLGDIAVLPSSGSGTDPFETLAETANGDLSTWAGSAAHKHGLTKAVDSKQLVSVVVGTFENLKTKRETYFGVEDGRTVNLHLVSVDSKLNLGEVVDFHNYSVLVQEISNTVLNPENEHLVENRLLPFFIQPTGERKASKWGRFGA